MQTARRSDVATAVPPVRGIPSRSLAFVVLVVLCVALFSVLVPVAMGLSGVPAPAAFVLGAALCGAPVLAVRWPRWSIVLFVVPATLLPLTASDLGALGWPWPWSVPAMLALVLFAGTLTAVHGWRIALVGWLLTIGATLADVFVRAGTVDVTAPIVNLVIVTSISGASVLVAALAASRLRVGAELTRERAFGAEEHDRRVAVEERARIARELHDVVAHGMSLIQVQASTARYRLPDLPDAVAAEFDDIARTARTSLTEMRRLLGVLRTEDQETALAPQQGLRDLPALVEKVRRAGATVSFVAPTVPGDVPAGVDIAAFRIAQEAVSNALRHAPGAPVDLDLVIDDAVRIRVHNAASTAAASSATGHGHGLTGMRERALLVGGTLEAGADPDGGWTVRAELPLEEPR